ncbi:hypothetical protein [Thiomonas sp. FB-6]|uniref:hypothetical protein n=1 Tax=Thiomonas sp. FB-6 TaxID=1158291 RepID=UPI00039C399C|nr:hypothetical protein [Thiomonas sp. FB-6]
MKVAASKTPRILAVLAVIVAVLAMGNPGLDDFAAYARTQLEDAPGAVGFFAGLLPGLTRSYLLSNTRRSNFGLFSVYRIDPGDPRSVAVLGVAWHFFPLGRSLSAPPPRDRASAPRAASSGV